ncbi:hypothetical protein [Blautia glucerasea]|uniref:hypothetical protein n=1 Tax=Blautia glucerasea TaxID=536633 RepID=UPI001D069A0F|nr:hypothetical protein [Blautia glucerasea]MCB6544091.1 hypothetical protein [Blautia glucerasea]
MMNRTRQILKKAVVTAMGASLVVSGSSTVFAASSYKEAEKTALANVVSELPGAWDDYLENYQKACEGTKGTFTLTVEDTGRALAGALMGGTDVSWLQSITFDSDITIKDGVEAIVSGLLLNDTKLCDLNFYMDLANMVEYIQIPELSDGYISAPIEGTVTTSEGVAENSQEIMSTYMNALSDLSSALPDSETLGTLLDRYGNIIIDHIEEGSSVEESVSVDGISEDCTAYEGTVSEKAVTAMAEGILTAAKDDAEIKGLFEQWAGASNGEDQYQQFEDAVADMLDSIGSADGEVSEDPVFSSKVWVNADNKIVGREFAVIDGAETTPVFTWKAPSDGDTSALLLEITAEDSSLTLTGSGTTSDGLLNGDYIFAIDGTEAADINVENLETKPEKAGYYNGTLNVTFPVAEADAANTDGESEAASNPLAGFGLVINLKSDASTDSSSIGLTVTTSGAPIATLTISGGYGDGVDIPDLTSLDKTYDGSDDAAMTEYVANINWDTFLANIKAAGVPDELATQLETILTSAVEGMTATDEDQDTSATDSSADGETEAADDAA